MKTQPQREAFLNLLILGCYLDGKHTLLETEEFDRIAGEIEWESSTACSLFISTQHAKAREIWENPIEVKKWVTQHSKPFTDEKEKELLIDSVEQFLGRDGFSSEEAGFLNQLRTDLISL